MNNFQFFTKELLQGYIVTCRGDVNEIAKRRGCSVVTVYGALRDHQLRGMQRAEKMRHRMERMQIKHDTDERINALLKVPRNEPIQMMEYRASQLRMLAHDESAPDYYAMKSRVDDAINKLREIARERIAKELGWKPNA